MNAILVRDRIWRPVPLPGDWHGAVLRVSRFPVPEHEVAGYRFACEELIRKLRNEFPGVSSQVYLQFHRLNPGADIARVQESARIWMPEVGLGVWPDREPPRLWTKDDLEEAEAPTSVRPLMFKVLRVQDDPSASAHAWDTLLGRGCAMQTGCSVPQNFLNHAAELFVPRMQGSLFASFPFYVPLLEARSCAEASAGDLDSWLRSCSFYLRESAEDEGLFVISSKPLAWL